MTSDTIRRLNQLNKDFYTKVAEEFDSTRQEYWPGWSHLIPHLKQLATQSPVKILDLGCGNGRFGEFLSENLSPEIFEYTGIDLNPALLTKAETKLAAKQMKAEFKAQDVVELTLTKQLSPVLGRESFNVISLMGVMHHVPSFELRLSLLSQLVELLQPNALFIFTTWQFMEFTRLSKKRVEPQQVGFTPAKLEPNDYFLNWERGEVAYRYCHYFDEAEHRQLTEHLQPTCKLLKEFRADGKEGNMDHYFVFQKLA